MDCKHFTDNLLKQAILTKEQVACAGPVYAAAVIMPRDTLEETPYILRDSKKLNRGKEECFKRLYRRKCH